MDAIRWDTAPIARPGVYAGVSMEAYHGQLTVGASVSSGILRDLEDPELTPAHVYAGLYLNPNCKPFAESEALIMGRAVHHLFGGEANFNKFFVVRPETYVDAKGAEKPWNGNAIACRAWLKQARDGGRDVLTAAQIDAIQGMANSLARHPAIKAGLLRGDVERTIVTRDEKTGIWLKSRPDVLPTGGTEVVDLKTCRSASPLAINKALGEHRYHMQLALAADVIKAVTGRQMTDFILVFVEKEPPYAVNVKPIDLIDIEYGRRECRRAIDLFARCVETGEWPGFEDDGSEAQLPAWYRNRLAEQAEHGLLPPADPAPAHP